MKKVTVCLPDGLKAELDRVADETHRSAAGLLREGLRVVLARYQPPPPRSGLFASGQSDLSERVEELLTGFGRQ